MSLKKTTARSKVKSKKASASTPGKAARSKDFRVVRHFVDAPRHATLLSAFVEKKIWGYVEPERKGTPKGDPIGIGGDKYRTILYCLREEKLKELAKRAGISYRLLCKWRNEEAFKAKLYELENEFSKIFCDYVLEHNVREFSEKGQAIPARNDMSLSDADDYSEGVVKAISRRLLNLWPIPMYGKKMNKPVSDPMLGVADAFMVIDYEYGKIVKKRIIETYKNQLGPNAVEGLKKFISKASAKEKDKKDALEFVNTLDFYNHI